MIPLKSICIPGSPPVDVSEFLPLIDHPLFQKLRYRSQLGVNFLVFPGAVHTRFEHALGVLALTQRFIRLHSMPGDSARTLSAFALLHDIGHGPFSHQVEPIIGGSHHEHGIVCLEAMSSALSACAIDRNQLTAMFREEHPFAQYVTDRNLGTDKLDYLMRDALHIGFPGTPDIERVQAFTTVDDGCLAIEEKFIEDIKRVQKFYSYLHQHGYLNKTALAAQRLLQRAVEEELSARNEKAETLWKMTDHQLMEWLRNGKSPLAKRLATRLDQRTVHRTVLAIKPDKYGFVERRSSKNIAVLEWPLRRLRRFSDICTDCERLRSLENDLAAICGLAPGELLFAAMPYFRKLIPRNVRIYSRSAEGSFWLFDKDRDHTRSLEGDYLRTFAVRVTVVPEQRAAAAAASDRIAGFLEDLVGTV
jgi:HD superfamily phosphohydrolase